MKTKKGGVIAIARKKGQGERARMMKRKGIKARNRWEVVSSPTIGEDGTGDRKSQRTWKRPRRRPEKKSQGKSIGRPGRISHGERFAVLLVLFVHIPVRSIDIIVLLPILSSSFDLGKPSDRRDSSDTFKPSWRVRNLLIWTGRMFHEQWLPPVLHPLLSSDSDWVLFPPFHLAIFIFGLISEIEVEDPMNSGMHPHWWREWYQHQIQLFNPEPSAVAVKIEEVLRAGVAMRRNPALGWWHWGLEMDVLNRSTKTQGRWANRALDVGWSWIFFALSLKG